MLRRPRSLKSRALQLLAQREQSKVELRRKLLVHARAAEAAAASEAGLAEADRLPGAEAQASAFDREAQAAPADTPASAEAQVDAVLAWLEANRFLSAERFAESRVNARAGRFGNLRIRHELARHEVSLTHEAEQALVDSELDRARAVRARKFSAAPDSAAEHARQARFLAARGFSSDVIRRVLREALRPDRGDA
ncbi:MAG: regulatory protein RecX [Caldimonas sp.]